jgi:ribosomal protein L29
MNTPENPPAFPCPHESAPNEGMTLREFTLVKERDELLSQREDWRFSSVCREKEQELADLRAQLATERAEKAVKDRALTHSIAALESARVWLDATPEIYRQLDEAIELSNNALATKKVYGKHNTQTKG